MTNREKEAMFRAYTWAWIHNDVKYLYEIINLHTMIIESNGLVYEDQHQIIAWFRDFQKENTMRSWEIKDITFSETSCMVLWQRSYTHKGKAKGGYGASYVTFKNDCINSIEEYERSDSYLYPYH